MVTAVSNNVVSFNSAAEVVAVEEMINVAEVNSVKKDIKPLSPKG